MNSKSKFKTLVILDLETSGLVYDEPKITELAIIAVHISTLDEMKSDEELPRVLNKLVKFFDPRKTIRSKATELSNLDNHMLKNYASFNHQTVIAIEHFLNDFQKLLCFVAHNGNRFDFPIFFNEIQTALRTNDSTSINQIDSSLISIACVDSINFFREIYRLISDENILDKKHIDNINASSDLSLSNVVSINRRKYVDIPIKSNLARQLPSMKLLKIYERELNRIPILTYHRAEDDCLMLLAILKRYLPDWLQWIDNNHRLLSDFTFLPSSTTKTTKFLSKKNVNCKRPFKF
ncbi:unnamed protein product [Rotaria sordida]|uniref:Exonuclease domain-containing protein n=1 Tax=Rotaria sordida TaxID=392033 RepID=A0A813YZT3_9BILA|nr:unnamed protein product [Rotaria sordida]CAF0891330.1 unnamed protein product [Rotaria sordida]